MRARTTLVGLATAFSALAAAPPALADTAVFTFTGASQIFVVPERVTQVLVKACGAQGGGSSGGLGGCATATISVVPGEVLHVFVGGRGGGPSVVGPGPGGFNGGAPGGSGDGLHGSGGGGASDVRRGGPGLAERVVVGGGGGGEGSNGFNFITPVPGGAGGIGGGTTGGDGVGDEDGLCDCPPGRGGGSTEGGAGGLDGVAGSLGTGGAGGGSTTDSDVTGGGGGGGGYYGGGGGASGGCFLMCFLVFPGTGGGGGSGFGPEGVVFAAGTRAGDGEVELTYSADTTAPAVTAIVTARQRLLRALRRGIRATTGCSEACALQAKLLITRKLARRLKLPRTVGKATGNLAAPGTTTLVVKFTAKARRKLAKLRTVRLTLELLATDPAGNAAKARKAVRLRR